ncbi:hypothetical protein CHK_0022 [Christensenella hongkongensis]|uniref:Uncharacterized protein n=1 Tax=Christensenella hongkongensis TaxID=270498 RepID=A0A0M2NPW9_9FIRM|nr:hypothetical protein CHK_0022 [Christensenella hongkongensis]
MTKTFIRGKKFPDCIDKLAGRGTKQIKKRPSKGVVHVKKVLFTM